MTLILFQSNLTEDLPEKGCIFAELSPELLLLPWAPSTRTDRTEKQRPTLPLI